MRRPRDLALQTGLYVAATISGVAAAYIFKEYMLHFWDSWNRDRRLHEQVDRDGDLEATHESKTDPASLRSGGPKEGWSSTAGSPASSSSLAELHPSNGTTGTIPLFEPDTVEVPRGETQTSAHTVPAQTRTLPPLRTHSLPPSPPNAPQLILSGAHPDVTSHITSPITRSSSLSVSRSWSMVGSEDESVTEDVDEDAMQVSSPISESLVEVLSPPPTQGISRRRSVRAHDLFAASHMSFSELGSMVSTDSQSN